MKETTGDLWQQQADAYVITTNGAVNRHGQAVMGRGVALQAKQRYPGIEYVLAERLRLRGNHVSLMGRLVSFPVKAVWNQRADTALIIQSVRELVELTNAQGWQTVVLPRPGCGNGGLSWDEVKAIIEPFLDDRFTVVNLP